MLSSIRKIGLLILVIIILPVLIFSGFEIGNLRNNEKVIQDIYRNQLDAILFSINQYSDDVMSNLASTIENSPGSHLSDQNGTLARLFEERPSVKCLLQFDSQFVFLSSKPDSLCGSLTLSTINGQLNEIRTTIQRLQTYLRGGYRKIATLDSGNPQEQWLLFLTRMNDKDVVNILIIDPEKFIGQVLDPKIQEIAKGKFLIAAFRGSETVPFYKSSKQYNSTDIREKKPFWLLKNYQMGIELTDLTIADLARERIRNNLLIIGLMDIILLLGAWLIFRNIRKQMELSQLKSDFVSNVSHEIRTPLALISMYIETLEMGRVTNDEKIREYYSVIFNETTRLSGMVNRILSFSQIENNKRNYSFGETNINDILESVSTTFRFTLKNKGFSYTAEPENSLPGILADREAITDALMNLIDNAIKYSAENKVLLVRTGMDDSCVYIEVEDHGIGISEKNQKFIFDKFFRVTEKNLANRVKGSGLGLAIVKHIMDAHKGKIIVKSSPGSGSVFRLLFPVK